MSAYLPALGVALCLGAVLAYIGIGAIVLTCIEEKSPHMRKWLKADEVPSRYRSFVQMIALLIWPYVLIKAIRFLREKK